MIVAPLSAREVLLLINVLEAKVSNARLIRNKWASTKVDEYDGDAEGLEHEVSFADGVHTGLIDALNLIQQITTSEE
jgi:hypothetical protein